MFTKEHYTKIAKLLKAGEESNPYLCTREFQSKLVQNFVLMLEKDNSKFDAETFLDIIYGKEEKHEER